MRYEFCLKNHIKLNDFSAIWHIIMFLNCYRNFGKLKNYLMAKAAVKSSGETPLERKNSSIFLSRTAYLAFACFAPCFKPFSMPFSRPRFMPRRIAFASAFSISSAKIALSALVSNIVFSIFFKNLGFTLLTRKRSNALVSNESRVPTTSSGPLRKSFSQKSSCDCMFRRSLANFGKRVSLQMSLINLT